jgi:Pyruvate/2-oxoacid:ferredoxin oxidoreductase delta subunit
MTQGPYESPYVRFLPERCIGCSDCLKACPTRAIRIRSRKSLCLVDRCIGCGACIRVCGQGAIKAVVGSPERIGQGHVAVAIVSPLLYAQFPNVMPKDVLLGLRRMGFNHTIDSSIFLEMYQCAAVEFIRRNRSERIAPWPLISPVCPAVVRLIAFRFPRLLAHVIPIMRPAALMAREIRRSLIPLYALQGRPVVLYYINPCPTMAEAREPAPGSPPCREVALGVNDVYPELMHCIDAVLSDTAPFPKTDFEYETCATGSASLVAMSGGEIAGMRVEKSVAVPGLKETTEYLSKIEMGLFQEMEYFELRTCPEGCLGGVLNAVDKYLAKGNVHRMMHLYGLGRRVPRHTIQQMYARGEFRPDPSPLELGRLFADRKPALTLEQMARIERILEQVGGYGCGACGSPDCATFAEDVVRGQARLEDCLWFDNPQPMECCGPKRPKGR